MYEINREKFGGFVSTRRKALGMTQKELAEKLFLSDKAVSKWERGLSLPDISVLVPLAGALGVTVTELLEGEPIKKEDTLSVGQVEQVVQKAIGLSDSSVTRGKRFQKKNLPVFFGMTLAAAAEFFAAFMLGCSWVELFSSLFTLELLSVLFGAYFWLFAATRLPAYYDENRINVYSDGIFHMNMPGVSFNNRNWGHILRACRVWSLLAATIPTPLYLLLRSVSGESLPLLIIILFLFLGGLFVPIYYAARKYA